MQFDRFISKNTQSKLILVPILPSKYLNDCYTQITGGTGQVLLDIHFYEPENSNDADTILNRIIALF